MLLQIQAPAKTTGNIHSQWLPVYEKKEDAALAYDIANTWRALRGICGITEQNVRRRTVFRALCPGMTAV